MNKLPKTFRVNCRTIFSVMKLKFMACDSFLLIYIVHLPEKCLIYENIHNILRASKILFHVFL